MKTKTIILSALMLFLSACQGIAIAGEPTATPLPLVTGETGVVAEGKLAPLADVTLSFNLGGTIAQVPVEEGQQVQAGDMLAALDQRERLASAVASAELEVVAARQTLDKLDENASVVTAAAAQEVADARDDLRDAERYRDNLISGARQTDIDKASANVILLEERLDDARENYKPYENKPDDNIKRANYLSQLADAQRQYDDAVRLLNNLEGDANEIDLAVAEANVTLAQARLDLAETEYADVKDGPDPDDLETAQARLTAAESALTAAQASLEDAMLVAPISGTVVRLDIKTGEQATPGIPAVVLADLSGWVVETEDLNEMDIPRVSVGQEVSVQPDALPELELLGEIDSISQYYVERFGDVTYTAKIMLRESDPRLRWGMTVQVRFEE